MTELNKTWITKQAATRVRRIFKAGVLLATVLAAPSVGLAQYTYVPTPGQSGNWNSFDRWTGGPVGTFPNGTSASATIGNPASLAPSGNYNVQLGQNITVESINVTHSVTAPGTLRIGANGSGTLTFQSASGTASYTENPGSTAGTYRTDIFAPVVFASDTVITQNREFDSNQGTLFSSTNNSSGGTTAASNVTVTKRGIGNITFEVPPTAPGTGFQGRLVIDQGGVRVGANVFSNAAEVVVNNGGQFQLASGTQGNWNLGVGSVLTLNGLGKEAGISPEGALRFNNGGNPGNFNNPVHLASDSGIDVQANSATVRGHLTLTQPVSGPGGIVKTGNGILSLASANTYEGTTVVNAGILRAVNETGSATGTGPVVINASGTLAGNGTIAGNVSVLGGVFSPGTSAGTLSLGSTVFDALSSLIYELGTPGVIGDGVNDLTNITGDLTLNGSLSVTQLPGFGLGTYRLFNYTGQLVDNGLELNLGTLPEGWFASLDTSIANQVNLSISVVPEPGTLALLVLGGAALVGAGVRQRRRKPSLVA